MNSKQNTLGVLIVILLAVALVFAFSKCKMSCSGYREGMQSHRLTTTHLLEDRAYGVPERHDYELKNKWNFHLNKSDKEKYTDIYKCNQKCGNMRNAGPRADCIQDCMASAIGATFSSLRTPCQSDGDCPEANSTCVSPSYYGGGDQGYCMHTNEPGIPAKIRNMREGYLDVDLSSESCKPGYFFNEVAGQCQNRWQGVSSAKAVQMSRPGPEPNLTLPGTTFPGYGVGFTNPLDVPIPSILKTNQ